ncbi:MAG: protein kinase [Planctomycetota bacterium]|nr:protein kinase [Planctomycetota bacterium]
MGNYESKTFNESGRYSQLSEISRGGMGIVYRAIDEEGQCPVAIKVIQDQETDFSEIQRFRREADALIQLNHPNILNLNDMKIENDKLILILEYVDGHDIAALQKLGQIQRNHKADITRVSRWFEDIARGMQYCHEMGMIHRDIKPHNILIEAETERPVIIDFGIVKKNSLQTQTPTGFSLSLTAEDEVLGTPAFMAPELFTGAEATAASDVWAFGATLFFALTGMVPFPGENPVQVYKRMMEGPPDSIHSFNSRVPDWLEEICLECLSEDPLDRPHFKRIIECFQEKKAAGVGPPTSRVVLWVLSALILLTSVIVAGLIILTPEPEPIELPTLKKKQQKTGKTKPGIVLPKEKRDYDLHYFLDELSDPTSLTRLPEINYSSRLKSDIITGEKAEIKVRRTIFNVAGPGCVTRIFLSRKVAQGKLSIFLDREDTPSFEFELKDMGRAGYKSVSNPWFKIQSDRMSIYLPIPFRKRCRIVFVGTSGATLNSLYYSIDYRKYDGAPVVTLTRKALESCRQKLDSQASQLKNSALSPENSKALVIPRGEKTALLKLKSSEQEGGQILRQWGLRFRLEEMRKEAYGLILRINIDGAERVRVPLLAFLMMNITDRIDPFKFKIKSRFTQIKHRNDWAFSCWPIAFRDSLTIELENRTNVDYRMDFQYRSEPSPWTDKSLYFTTHWKRGDRLSPNSTFGLKIENNPGYYVGTYLTVHNPVNLWWSYGPVTINTSEQSLGSPKPRDSNIAFQELYFGDEFSQGISQSSREFHDAKNSYKSSGGVWSGSPVHDSRGRNASTHFRWRELDRIFFQKKIDIDFPSCHEGREIPQARAMISFFYLQKEGPQSDPVGSTKLPTRYDMHPGEEGGPGQTVIEGEEMLWRKSPDQGNVVSKMMFESASVGAFGHARGVLNFNCFGCLYWNYREGQSRKRITVFAPVKKGRYKVFFDGFRTNKNPLLITLNNQVIPSEKWTSLAPTESLFRRVFWGEIQVDGKITLTVEFSGSNPQSEELYLDYLHFVPAS